MKIKWNVIGIMFIITAILIMQIPVSEADATSASDFKMEGTTLISYTGTESHVSVPDTVEVIGKSAFENNTSITQVTIPSSVKSIEPYAFWGCNQLERVNLGTGLSEVGDFTFTNCPKLKTIYFPENIRRIGIMAFADCVSLTEIKIPYTVYEVQDTAFDGCYQLQINYDVGSEGERFALYFEEKKKEMPEYEDIDEYEEVITTPTENPVQEMMPTPQPTVDSPGTVLGSTSVVGNMAVIFMDNTSLNVVAGGTTDTAKEENNQLITEYITEKGKGTVKYTLVDGEVLADRAYYGSQELKQISLPEGTKEIGEFSFARSTLTAVIIPEGVETIGYGAFYHCDRLQEVNLPDTITCIAPKAFDYTRWIEEFNEKESSDFLIAGDGILIAYKGNADQLVIPDGVKQIGPEVFQGHSEITSVKLPDSVTIIGEAAFADCTNLYELEGMSQVRIIRDRAFYHCPIQYVILPETVETVGLGAFARESKGGVILIQGQIPEYAQEVSAERRSNRGYRINAFEGVEYVLLRKNPESGELKNTVLDSNRAIYHGIIGHLENGVFVTDFTYLTEDEIKGQIWSDQVNIGQERYVQRGMENLSLLTPIWTEAETDELSIQGETDAQANLVPQGIGDVLQISRLNSTAEAEGLTEAYRRVYQEELPGNTICYAFHLYEGESGIAIKRLGKQAMEVVLQLPEQLQNKELRVITLDCNGQLEYLSAITDGKQLQFTTDYLSVYGIYGSGTIYAQENVTDGQVIISAYGHKDDSPDTGDIIHPKWVLGIGLLFTGFSILLFASKKKPVLPV